MKIVTTFVAFATSTILFAENDITKVAENWGDMAGLVGEAMSSATTMTCSEYNSLIASDNTDDQAKAAAIMSAVFMYMNQSGMEAERQSSAMTLAALTCSSDPGMTFMQAFGA